MNKIYVTIAALASVTSLAEVNVYCVTKSGHNFGPINPQLSFSYSIEQQPLVKGSVLKLGGVHAPYSINEKDMENNKFSALMGLATPKAYFLYSRDQASDATAKSRSQDVVSMLRKQCLNLFEAINFSKFVFSEVRVSESAVPNFLSKVGYPLVFIRLPVKPGEQNIFRVNVETDETKF